MNPQDNQNQAAGMPNQEQPVTPQATQGQTSPMDNAPVGTSPSAPTDAQSPAPLNTADSQNPVTAPMPSVAQPKKSKFGLIIIVAVVVLIAAGAAIFLM